jgi:nitronate monooxygenase
MSQKHKRFIRKEQLVLPVFASPMFLVSNPELVIACCKAGIVGSFPSLNARSVDLFKEWMDSINRELAVFQADDPAEPIAPWAVNLVIHNTTKRYEQDLEAIREFQPPIVITSLGNPAKVVEVVHGYGGYVFSDVINIQHAKKVAENGVDGLILVCGGAGGHAGTLNSFAFLAAVREFWDGMIALAGGISNGHEILAARILGADFAYMGTKFIAASESLASQDYKKMLIDSTIEDVVYTDAFSGVKANYLIPSIRNAGLNPEDLQKKENIDFSFLQAGVKAWKDIWSAGQGVGQIKKVQSVQEIVDNLQLEYNEGIAKLV